jgi:hypothetical protein
VREIKKKIMSVTRKKCQGYTKSGKKCKKCTSSPESDFCFWHADKCTICLLPLQKKLTPLPSCSHTFHTSCIRRWHRRSRSCGDEASCPLCRTTFERADIDDENYVPELSDDDEEEEEELNTHVDEDRGEQLRRLVERRRRLMLRMSFLSMVVMGEVPA